MFWLFEECRPNGKSSAIELSQVHIDRVTHQSPSRAMAPSTVSKAEQILRTRSDKFDVTERTSIQYMTRTGENHNGSPDQEPSRFSSAFEYHTDHHHPDTFLLHIGAQFYGANTNNKVKEPPKDVPLEEGMEAEMCEEGMEAEMCEEGLGLLTDIPRCAQVDMFCLIGGKT